jgi:hypothetical protein
MESDYVLVLTHESVVYQLPQVRKGPFKKTKIVDKIVFFADKMYKNRSLVQLLFKNGFGFLKFAFERV